MAMKYGMLWEDENGVTWRKINGKPVKIHDPHFVHEKVLTPKALDHVIIGITMCIVLLVGALLGAAL